MAYVRNYSGNLDETSSQEQQILDMVMRDLQPNTWTGIWPVETATSAVLKLNLSPLFNNLFIAAVGSMIDPISLKTLAMITISSK